MQRLLVNVLNVRKNAAIAIAGIFIDYEHGWRLFVLIMTLSSCPNILHLSISYVCAYFETFCHFCLYTFGLFRIRPHPCHIIYVFHCAFYWVSMLYLGVKGVKVLSKDDRVVYKKTIITKWKAQNINTNCIFAMGQSTTTSIRSRQLIRFDFSINSCMWVSEWITALL